MYAIEFQLELAGAHALAHAGPGGGAVFLMKAAMLSGVFYIHAVVLCLTGLVMAWLQHQIGMPNIGLTVFGVVFVPLLLHAGLEILPPATKPLGCEVPAAFV